VGKTYHTLWVCVLISVTPMQNLRSMLEICLFIHSLQCEADV
jgi:hypothetical protein